MYIWVRNEQVCDVQEPPGGVNPWQAAEPRAILASMASRTAVA